MSHTVIDCANLSGNTLSLAKAAPLKPPPAQWARITEDDVKDPVKLFRLLETMRADMSRLIAQADAGPFSQSITFRNLSVDAGVSFTVRHNFNCRAFWSVVDMVNDLVDLPWASTALFGFCDTQVAPYITATGATNTTITFTPFAKGTLSILVFC